MEGEKSFPLVSQAPHILACYISVSIMDDDKNTGEKIWKDKEPDNDE